MPAKPRTSPTSCRPSGRAVSSSHCSFDPTVLFGPASGAAHKVWIGYDDAHAHLPQAKWVQSIKGARQGFLRVADAGTALEAVACGLGVSFLPRLAAAGDARLREIIDDLPISARARSVWLLSHVDQRMRASVSVTKDWLMTLPWDDVG
ncbi:LysR substrate-binding domain-containing protein [Chelativorans salis]|uniref:LysR substrate-binding domain-containing protein n=1 Tax=Chelativorans salis TaxID=2978478 RepID=UPI003CC5EC9B